MCHMNFIFSKLIPGKLITKLCLHFDRQEMRAAFEAEAAATGRERLLLTAAVGAGKSTIEKAYEIDLISA